MKKPGDKYIPAIVMAASFLAALVTGVQSVASYVARPTGIAIILVGMAAVLLLNHQKTAEMHASMTRHSEEIKLEMGMSQELRKRLDKLQEIIEILDLRFQEHESGTHRCPK